MEIKNVSKFLQYKPWASLKPFMSSVTEMRIAAVESGENTKGNSAKLIGNSGYVSYFNSDQHNIIF